MEFYRILKSTGSKSAGRTLLQTSLSRRNTEGTEKGGFPTYAVLSIRWPWFYSQVPETGDHSNICSSWHRWLGPAPGRWAVSHSSQESPESFSLSSWERFMGQYPWKLTNFVLIVSDDDKFRPWGWHRECIYLTGISWVTGIMHRAGGVLLSM